MTLYALLPPSWRPYAKTVVAVVGTVLSVLAVGLPAVPPWVVVATNVLTALGVWGVPNTSPGTDDPTATRADPAG
ncbi:hypothetical protein [Cellulomonas sp. C5510]|uniref:DUF7439 family protein n=1 Tax=Cellulomonas sp. C5510 TaxID=2871170 RepID=UPI001C96EF19|nr:hypothetical protein [Cellulomonas sp. C5510]QZN86600.1 hypothetical protein K5O09_05485 [Cellulomonas sp. C5510]